MPTDCLRCSNCCTGVVYLYENLTPAQRDAIIEPRTDGCCMLNEDKLCKIWLKHGFEAIPDICQTHICKERKDG